MFLPKPKLAIVLLVGACGIAAGSGALGYRMAIVKQAAAPLDATEQAPLLKIAGPLDGVVRSVEVKAGSNVRKGDVLVKLDNQVAAAEVKINEAKVAAVEAELDTAAKTKAEAYQLWQTQRRLQNLRDSSPEEVRQAKLTYERYHAEEISKQQAVKVAKLELERAMVSLEMHAIRSPVDGVVKAVSKQPGEAMKRLETAIVIRAEKKPG